MDPGKNYKSQRVNQYLGGDDEEELKQLDK